MTAKVMEEKEIHLNIVQLIYILYIFIVDKLRNDTQVPMPQENHVFFKKTDDYFIKNCTVAWYNQKCF